MRTWTVVVELTEDANFSAQEVELMFTRMLANAPLHRYKVYEVTQAKYGPEPDSVILKENKRP